MDMLVHSHEMLPSGGEILEHLEAELVLASLAHTMAFNLVTRDTDSNKHATPEYTYAELSNITLRRLLLIADAIVSHNDHTAVAEDPSASTARDQDKPWAACFDVAFSGLSRVSSIASGRIGRRQGFPASLSGEQSDELMRKRKNIYGLMSMGLSDDYFRRIDPNDQDFGQRVASEEIYCEDDQKVISIVLARFDTLRQALKLPK